MQEHQPKDEVLDAFRQAEKFYRLVKADPPKPKDKRKRVPKRVPDFSNVFDFRVLDNNTQSNLSRIRAIELKKIGQECLDPFVMLSSNARAYQIDSVPGRLVVNNYEMNFFVGFYIISNALSIESQIFWARTALVEYSTAEHTNLYVVLYWNAW